MPWAAKDQEHPISFKAMVGILVKLGKVRGRGVPASYKNKTWEELDSKQKGKLRAFWDKLSKEDHDKHTQTATTVTAAAGNATGGKAARSAHCTSDEVARLLHIMHDPRYTAERAKVLQGTKSRQDMEDREDPWEGIATIYNDKDVKYENLAVEYVGGVKVTEGGYKARGDNVTAIAADVWDLDPTAPDRPHRDAAFLKEKWRDIKTDITHVYNNFTQSGMHPEERALAYSEFEADVVVAAPCEVTKSSSEASLGLYTGPRAPPRHLLVPAYSWGYLRQNTIEARPRQPKHLLKLILR